MATETRYSSSALGYDTKLVAGRRWSIRLLMVACLVLGQLLPNGAMTQESGRIMIAGDCIEIVGNTQEGLTIFALIGVQEFGMRNDGTPLFELPSGCFVRAVAGETSQAGAGRDDQAETASARVAAENMANGLRDNDADAQTVERAKGKVQRQIDRAGPHHDPAESLQQTAIGELDNPDGDYATALLGLMTAGCMAAAGSPVCALLPAVFGCGNEV